MQDLKITTNEGANSAAAPTAPTLRRLTPNGDLTAWDLAAQAIDRVLFFSYVLIDVVFLAVYLRGG